MQKWEYLHVFAVSAGVINYKLVPRDVNGQGLPNWEKGPTIFEFANQLGEQGWELVAAEDGFTRLTFKRPKP